MRLPTDRLCRYRHAPARTEWLVVPETACGLRRWAERAAWLSRGVRFETTGPSWHCDQNVGELYVQASRPRIRQRAYAFCLGGGLSFEANCLNRRRRGRKSSACATRNGAWNPAQVFAGATAGSVLGRLSGSLGSPRTPLKGVLKTILRGEEWHAHTATDAVLSVTAKRQSASR